MSNSNIKQLLFEHGLDDDYEGSNKLSRLGKVFHPLVKRSVHSSEMKNTIELLEALAKTALDKTKESDDFGISSHAEERARKTYDKFKDALRADGLDLVEARVVPFLSPSVNIGKERGLLESRLRHYKFGVASNHLEQAVDNAARAQWESANGQIRSFLEALCDSITSLTFRGPGNLPSRGKARKNLAEVGFLDVNEAALLKAFFKVLHGEGGHSGTSSSDDCHRRLLMAVSLSNYYLDRLDNWEE